MRKLLFIAVLTGVLPAARGAEPKWIRMPSSDFEIYSSAGEGDTRRALQYLERVRSFFEQALGGGAGQKREPVRVIVFGSKKEYEQYRPNDFAAAYYTRIAGRDYIVLGSVNDEVFPIAVHEYVHLVTQNAGMKFPPWFNEGIAELFSTMKPTGDKVLVGAPVVGRALALSREKWVPLSVIVAATHDSPYYNEKSKAGSLYDEGWLLTHMLELDPQYSPKFGQFLKEMENGTPSQKVIEGVWGKPLEAVEKDLHAYLQVFLRGGTTMASVFPVKLQGGEKVAAEPAVMFDVKLTLLDLSNRRGKEADAKVEFQDLIKEDPKRPEPYVALGYLAARDGEQEQAIESFGKAVELGSRNPQMLWDFGRMAARVKPQQAMGALQTLLADQPNRFEVRLALAQIQMNSKLAKEAIETLAPVKKVTPEDAPRFFQILAFAHMQNGEREAARSNAQRWLDNTKDTDERLNANRMLRYLDQQDAPAAVSAASPPPLPRLDKLDGGDAGDSTPKLVRAQPLSPERAPARLELPSVSGTLVELDCKGPLPKFVLQAEGGRVSLLMDDPKSVLISGLSEGTIDLNCGPLKQVAVWIQYDPPTVAAPGLKGIVRAIHYEPEPGKLKAR